MGRASKSRAPSEYEYSNPELERVRASALILGPSFERVRASFSSIPHIVNAKKNSTSNFQKKLIFVISFFTSFLCFTFSIENFLVNLYRGENNLFLRFWCCNFHILDTLMLAEYSPSINPEHERVRACARTPKPEPEHHQKHRVPSEHRASMCSDPSLILIQKFISAQEMTPLHGKAIKSGFSHPNQV